MSDRPGDYHDTFELHVNPFVLSDETEKQRVLKPLEEAAEIYGAWQEGRTGDFGRTSLMYEIADTITACVNLAESIGAEPSRLQAELRLVQMNNERRGRYEH